MKLRQGQTVYYIDQKLYTRNSESVLVKVFLHSQKVPLPPIGVIVERVPVTLARDAVSEYGFKFFKSRRKAEKALSLLNGGRV
jgi:hypothetical protein